MITVRLFAVLRERLGVAELQLDAGVPPTVDALIERLAAERGEQWSAALRAPQVLCAVNRRHRDRRAVLRDGDEVAFFPPVTGG